MGSQTGGKSADAVTFAAYAAFAAGIAAFARRFTCFSLSHAVLAI